MAPRPGTVVASMRFASLITVFALVVSACGSSGVTIEEYFGELDDAVLALDQADTDLAQQYQTQLAEGIDELQARSDLTDPAQIEELARKAFELGVSATVSLLTARTVGLELFVSRLRAVQPPSEVSAEHATALEAATAALDALPGTIEAVNGIGSIEEMTAILAGSPFGIAQTNLGEACRQLQTIAVSADIEVDLACARS